MEPISALSLTCNVMQVIESALKAASLCRQVYKTGSIDPQVNETARHLANICHDLHSSLQSGIKPLTRAEHELAAMAEKTIGISEELRKSVDSLSVAGNRRLFRAIAVTAKATWKKHRIEGLQKELSRCQDKIELSLISRVCDRTQAQEIQQTQAFQTLDDKLRYFIKQYAAGQTKFERLLEANHENLKKHIDDTAGRMREVIQNHVETNLAATEQAVTAHTTAVAAHSNSVLRQEMGALTDARTREVLLESLRYPDMNSRKNHIGDEHRDTFRWVFTRNPRSWDSFVLWLESGHGLYWISGKPASGKSTLMRFIVANAQTTEALKVWAPDARILSHYFWLAGSEKQRNMGGFLCSLLYQLAQQVPGQSVTDIICRVCPDAMHKRSIADWHVSEMEKALVEVVREAGLPWCIFVDGLDEFAPQRDVQSLFKILEKLKCLPGVKICVSSRPEPRLRDHLIVNPRLRVQDLTHSDIEKVARDLLPDAPGDGRYSARDEYRALLSKLIDKADGVFLWVVLASKSLRDGLKFGDDWEELTARLEALPSDLTQLYEDMWLRLNGDQDIYRKSAALYLGLAMRDQEDTLLWQTPWTVLGLMLATNETFQEKPLIEHPERLSVDEVRADCQRTLREINVRCAGLLQVTRRSLRLYDVLLWQGEDWKGILEYLKMVVSFTHRTAFDFLANTVSGKGIMAHGEDRPYRKR
ncbi:hypothetical protein F4780DRAFT_777212 [Xylariomycetidae sp. FL0641]|nr:hypothetical protein F4780DRAFT_777212 [Xylariomycetidae sp. FL0641]